MMNIKFDEAKQLVIAERHGTASRSEVIQLINSAVEVCQKHDCFEIVFDMQATQDIMSFQEAYELNKNLMRDTHLNHLYRCAVVYAMDETKIDKAFYETVGLNWGQGIFKIFFNLEQGKEWLRPDTTLDS